MKGIYISNTEPQTNLFGLGCGFVALGCHTPLYEYSIKKYQEISKNSGIWGYQNGCTLLDGHPFLMKLNAGVEWATMFDIPKSQIFFEISWYLFNTIFI